MSDIRNVISSLGVSLVAALLLLATGDTPAQAVPTEVKPISWDVGGIGASGRTLRLQYTPGSRCGGTFLGAQARVTESASTVTIELVDVVDFPPPSPAPMPCPAVGAAPRPVWVTLTAPLSGRSIKGRIPFPGSTVPVGPPNYPPTDPAQLIRVPRVVGFSLWEARRIIWRSGLNITIRRSRRAVARSHVIGQAPAGSLRPREVVRLHVAVPR